MKPLSQILEDARSSDQSQDIEMEGLPKQMDDKDMVRLGKKPVLKTGFLIGFGSGDRTRFLTSNVTAELWLYVDLGLQLYGAYNMGGFFGVGEQSHKIFLALKKLLKFCSVFDSGFTNGGPAGIIYGYVLVWIGTLSTFATLSELTSMAPTSGGQYHWVSMMAPPKYQKFLSYITGWLTVSGWQAFVASDGYLNGTMTQGLIILSLPGYVSQPWHAVMLYWGIILFCVFINTIVSSWLPKFEGLILILHILGFFAIIFPLVILGPHGNSSDVFTTFHNGGNWPTNGLSFMVGLLGNVFAFFGADAAIHMSEEIQNASVVVPQSIMLSIVLNGAMGFGMALALLFCIGDVSATITPPTTFLFIDIFYQAVQSRVGAALMTALVVTLALCATVGTMASASRQLWSFSRDRAVPGWKYLQRVDPRTAVPVASVAVTTMISCLLALIALGSSTVFNDIVSLSVVGLFGSYQMAAVLLLLRRWKGEIQSYESHLNTLTNVPGAPLEWGPWRVPEPFGTINNVFTITYLTIIFFFSLWPPGIAPTVATMNYGVLMLGVALIFSITYYFAYARKVYTGPVIEIS
ncbi:MAG: hypothetical protein MMC33_004563 [Icmadophila ericetorum]|nr:hypothetical protein [Icmadophila ericetorum]